MQVQEQSVRGRKFPWTWIGMAIAIAGLLAAGRMIPFHAWLQELTGPIAALGPAGVVLYALVYAAAAVLFLPGSVLTIGAGFVFGLGWGTVSVSMGSTLGAALAFLVSRYLAREKVTALAQRNEKFAAIDKAIGREGWKIVLLLRLSPLIPFNLSNYLYGLTAVPFWKYLAASWIGMLPGTLLYVYLGVAGRTSLEAAAGQGTARNPWQTALLAVGLAATVVVTWYVSRIARKALRKTELEQEQ